MLQSLCTELKRVGHVANADPLAIDQHADHVETVRLPRPPVAADPCARRPGQLALFAPVDRFDWIAEVSGVAGFHLDERDEAAAFDDEIDIPMA